MVVPDRTVTRVSWRDLFPWLILLRTLPIATSVTVLAFATLGVVTTPIGWLAGEAMFLNDSARFSDPYFTEFVESSRSPYRGVFDASRRPANYLELFGAKLTGARAVYERMVMPYRMIFRGGLGIRKFCYLLTGCVWTLMVWTFAGCAISRFALLRLTREETLPIDEVFHFSRERWGVCLLAFAACFGVVALLCVPGFFIGLLLVNDWSAWLGGLLWIFVVGFSAAMAFLLFGLMFAWPLIVTSVAAENQNALDAVTRSLAYVFQRPLNYALYGLIALAFGGFCWLIVSQIAASTIQLAFWNGSWGASVYNENRMDEFIGTRSFELEPARASEAAAVTNPDERAFTLKAGANLIRFANGLVSTLAVAFMYGLFWTLSSGVYLLLRHDVDETEMDEVFIDEESRTYDLPPLKSDAYGIPQIQPLEEYQQTMENKNNERNNLDGLGE